MSPFITIWAKGSPSSARPSKVRNTGRTASPVRLSVITISVIGWALPAISSQTPSRSSIRRPAAATAEARVSRPIASGGAASTTVTAKLGVGEAERQRQRQADMAAAGDQDVDAIERRLVAGCLPCRSCHRFHASNHRRHLLSTHLHRRLRRDHAMPAVRPQTSRAAVKIIAERSAAFWNNGLPGRAGSRSGRAMSEPASNPLP